MKKKYLMLVLLFMALGGEAFTCAAEYKENEAENLVVKIAYVQKITQTKEEIIKEFNEVYGDGFGDYVYNSPQRGVNI